jgi:hypothetical protein
VGRLSSRRPARRRGGLGGRAPPEFIFGYGSLAHDLLADVTVTRLRGYRRRFGAAADNSHAIPGYKRYRSADGSFPDVFVAYLDLVEDPQTAVNGVLAPVDAAPLADLDRRERNYDRIDVTAAIDTPPPGRVWAYVGSPDGRERLEKGLAAGIAVVQRDYLEHVHAGFRRLGAIEYDQFLATSDLDGLPLLDLERVDLPPEDPTQ